MPQPVLEEPYSLSFINLYDSQLNSIWTWGCTDCPQDKIRAAAKVEAEIAKQQDTYVQWPEPKQFNLHPEGADKPSDDYLMNV